MILYRITVTYRYGASRAVWFASRKNARAAKKQIEKEYDENIRRCEEPIQPVRISRKSIVSNQDLANWLNKEEFK